MLIAVGNEHLKIHGFHVFGIWKVMAMCAWQKDWPVRRKTRQVQKYNWQLMQEMYIFQIKDLDQTYQRYQELQDKLNKTSTAVKEE